MNDEPTQLTGEIIAAHPTRVAQADQIAAAQPRKKPSRVVLNSWIPTDKVYILNLDKLCERTGLPNDDRWLTR